MTIANMPLRRLEHPVKAVLLVEIENDLGVGAAAEAEARLLRVLSCNSKALYTSPLKARITLPSALSIG